MAILNQTEPRTGPVNDTVEERRPEPFEEKLEREINARERDRQKLREFLDWLESLKADDERGG
jgi:hypothetical protein